MVDCQSPARRKLEEEQDVVDAAPEASEASKAHKASKEFAGRLSGQVHTADSIGVDLSLVEVQQLCLIIGIKLRYGKKNRQSKRELCEELAKNDLSKFGGAAAGPNRAGSILLAADRAARQLSKERRARSDDHATLQLDRPIVPQRTRQPAAGGVQPDRHAGWGEDGPGLEEDDNGLSHSLKRCVDAPSERQKVEARSPQRYLWLPCKPDGFQLNVNFNGAIVGFTLPDTDAERAGVCVGQQIVSVAVRRALCLGLQLHLRPGYDTAACGHL